MSNINPELIEESIRKSQEKKNVLKKKFEFNEKNYLNTRLNKGETSRQIKIRVLPVSADNMNAFLTLHTHSLKVNQEISKTGFKQFICLNDENAKDERGCPLCNKCQEMINESNGISDPVERKAVFKAAMQYKAKETYIVRVIERGHEDEGVKFWRFNAHKDGKGFFDQLISLYQIRNQESIDATGEPYNIFDLDNGKDIIITLTLDPGSGKTSATIADAGFNTPLSKDAEQKEAWINDEKTWQDVYSSKSYEYLEIVANGEVPFYDKDNNKWVAKIEKDADEDNDEETEPVSTPASEEDDDLPF